MPSPPPDGEPVPPDGSLPVRALAESAHRPLSFYVHVPYCTTRCGYCDFNTYTATELGPGVSRSTYRDQAVAEVRLARRVLGQADLPVQTVFFGGGTPTLLAPEDLAGILSSIRDEFGLAPDAEVTTEANPDSVTAQGLEALRRSGFTRVSFGMQSTAAHVLATLDRTHTPGRALEAVEQARNAGFDHVSLDLIYGTPGESEADFAGSLAAATGSAVDHVSAYSLTAPPGTRLAARVARGELTMPDDDVVADRYCQAEAALTRAGMNWYEISSWARPHGQCRHNLAYWHGDNWWGVGPGAHSHVGGVRWWNVRHPAAYAARLAGGNSPAQAREVLTAQQRRVEDVLLRLRLRTGVPLTGLTEPAQAAAVRAVGDGLLEPAEHAAGTAVATLRGRLLVDALVRELTE
jgi:oxygen-independent coproporphyrinogen-3 oxidase